MSIGAFTDKNHCPAAEEMQEIVGARLAEWNALASWIREHYAIQEDLHFMYGRKYGWGRRVRVGGSLLTCLYPAEGRFAAQVILNQEALARAEMLKLGKNSRDAMARAHPYAEGKWLFIEVTGPGDVRDVERLLELKREAGRRKK